MGHNLPYAGPAFLIHPPAITFMHIREKKGATVGQTKCGNAPFREEMQINLLNNSEAGLTVQGAFLNFVTDGVPMRNFNIRYEKIYKV